MCVFVQKEKTNCFRFQMATNIDDDGLESVLGDDDEFQEAALFVQNNLQLFSRDDLLYLYARFKQVNDFY